LTARRSWRLKCCKKYRGREPRKRIKRTGRVSAGRREKGEKAGHLQRGDECPYSGNEETWDSEFQEGRGGGLSREEENNNGDRDASTPHRASSRGGSSLEDSKMKRRMTGKGVERPDTLTIKEAGWEALLL